MHVEVEASRPASPATNEKDSKNSSTAAISCREPAAPADHAPSPALLPWKPGGASAYEMKFLLDEPLAGQVESLLAPHLVRDPFCLPDLGNAYRIATVYCDTPEYEVFHGVGTNRRRKFRLRAYGTESRVYLERKTKKGRQVRKKRTTVSAEDLTHLSGFQRREGWTGDWFHRQLLDRRLHPVCCLSYLRTAYVGSCEEGPMRLTFDRGLAGFASTSWSPSHEAPSQEAPSHQTGQVPFLAGHVVCEFKFRGSLPTLFKSAIQSLQLTPCGISKYRHCLQAAGVPTDRNERHA